MQTLLTSHSTSKSHYLVLVRTYIPALRPPMLIHKVKSFFHCLELFTAFHITFLSWVRSTALPLPTEHTLAISSRALGYSFQFSCLEPLLFPKGKSEMNTSMLLAFKGRLHTSHWKISRGRVFLHLKVVETLLISSSAYWSQTTWQHSLPLLLSRSHWKFSFPSAIQFLWGYF